MKLGNVLDGLPNKSFLMCPVQVSLSTVVMKRFAERSEQQLPGEDTGRPTVTDHKQIPETNDGPVQQSTETFEPDGDKDDLNCEDVGIGDAKPTIMAASPRPVSLLPPMIGVASEMTLQLGVSECVGSNVVVGKKKKHKEAKTMCCLQRQYLDLSLPKLQPQWRIGPQIDTKQLSRQLKRKRHLPRITNLRNAANNVSFVYLTQESSNIEFRLVKNNKTKTRNV